jgi:hypothetical protein
MSGYNRVIMNDYIIVALILTLKAVYVPPTSTVGDCAFCIYGFSVILSVNSDYSPNPLKMKLSKYI